LSKSLDGHHEGHEEHEGREEGKKEKRGARKKMEFDELSNKVIGCVLEVHRELGPGLLESAYQQCLYYELTTAHLKFVMEQPFPVKYKNLEIDCGYRLDILVEECLLIEIKSVEKIIPVHKAQILTYMKLAQIKTGLLINFNVPILKNGIERFVL
jgi:GxxExxY protein